MTWSVLWTVAAIADSTGLPPMFHEKKRLLPSSVLAPSGQLSRQDSLAWRSPGRCCTGPAVRGPRHFALVVEATSVPQGLLECTLIRTPPNPPAHVTRRSGHPTCHPSSHPRCPTSAQSAGRPPTCPALCPASPLPPEVGHGLH